MDDSRGRPATIFVYDLANEAKALRIAQSIAAKTGRVISVRRPGGDLIETVFPSHH